MPCSERPATNSPRYGTTSIETGKIKNDALVYSELEYALQLLSLKPSVGF